MGVWQICYNCDKIFFRDGRRYRLQLGRGCKYPCCSVECSRACKASVTEITNTYERYLERFNSKLNKTPGLGNSVDYPNCWEWKGKPHHSGYCYTNFYKHTKNKGIHQIAWMIENGEIPKGLEVMHKCDNRRCGRVDHLELGTHLQNVQDMVDKGRQIRGQMVSTSKMTDENVTFMRQNNMNFLDAKEKYGINRSTYKSIMRGKTYPHLPYATSKSKKFKIIPELDEETIIKFKELIRVSDKDDCWEWLGSVDSSKHHYGEFRVDGKLYKSHRIAYELGSGVKLGEQELIRHICNNPKCNNYRHLIPGTDQDNADDKVRAGRSCRGVKSNMSKLKFDYQVLEIYRILLNNVDNLTYKQIGSLYGLSRFSIGEIKAGKTWRHLYHYYTDPRP